MPATMQLLRDRHEWEQARLNTIGGSDAAAIIGKSPYMSNVDLWRIKTGREQPKDLSNLEIVQYGHDAEPLIRSLFALDNPIYAVDYQPDAIIRNERYPFAHASVDGLLTRKSDKAFGILEIKTATIQSATQAAKWKDGNVPINYLIQVLWYMGVCEADFGVICAQLKKTDFKGDMYKETRQYYIDRADHEQDIRFLMLKGETFWRYVTEDKKPPIILDF